MQTRASFMVPNDLAQRLPKAVRWSDRLGTSLLGSTAAQPEPKSAERPSLLLRQRLGLQLLEHRKHLVSAKERTQILRELLDAQFVPGKRRSKYRCKLEIRLGGQLNQ